jgi:outer membrane protein
MIRRTILSILPCLLCVHASLAQQSFTLQEAVAYAIEHHADVQVERLNVADADGQLLEYKSIGIPKLSGSVDYTYFIDIPTQLFPDFLTPAVYGILDDIDILPDGTPIPEPGISPIQFGQNHNVDASLNFNTLLFDFSWIQGLKAQRLFRELVQKRVKATAYEVESQVIKAYLNVLVNQRRYELLDDNIRNLSKLLEETTAIYENGFAEKLDVDRLVLSLGNLETTRQNVERLIVLSSNLLKFQMSYPIEQELTLTDGFDIVSDQVKVEQVDLAAPVDFNSRPEYSPLLLAEQLNEINIKAIKAGYLPALSARATHSQVLQRDMLFDSDDSPWFPTTFVGVTLDVPIFDGLERKAKLDRARINLDKAGIRVREFERAVEMQVRNARLQYINARETSRQREEAMELAQSIYDTTQIKYREGVGSSIELTQAEADLYEAQTNYINALYELIVAKADLDIALGNI